MVNCTVNADETVRDVPVLSPESLAGLTLVSDDDALAADGEPRHVTDDEATRERRQRFAKIVAGVMAACGAIGVAAIVAALVRTATAEDPTADKASAHMTSAVAVIAVRSEAAPAAAPAPQPTTKAKPAKVAPKSGAFGTKSPARTAPAAKTKSR